MKKMIIIVDDIWEDSNQVWGFDLFAENGFLLEIWRVGSLTIGTKIWEKPSEKYKTFTIQNMMDMRKKIVARSMQRPLYMFYITGRSYFDEEKVLIKLLGGQYCNVSIAPLGSRSNCIRYQEVKATSKHWMDRFPAKYNFLGADIHKCALHSNREMESDRNVIIHIYDYDCYIKNQNIETDIDYRYILFFDQNFLEHKDQVNFDVRKWIPNEKKYIQQMEIFLEKIEKDFNLPIVVAAHPTAKKEDLKRIYGNRKIVSGNTCGYTKKADFVITFNSGAINYAVLYKKPILIWTCDQLKNTDLYLNWQHIKAKRLKARMLDISKDVTNINISDYLTNPCNYEEFLKFITGNINENRTFFEIVVDYLTGTGRK